MKFKGVGHLPIEDMLDLIYGNTECLIERIESMWKIANETQENHYLNSKESADYLGISINTLYQYSSRGILKSNHPSGRLMFRKAELDDFIDKNPKRRKSQKEIEQESEKHSYKLREKAGSNILKSL